MGMRFFAKAIWGNEDWTLFKLRRGIIGHSGERYHVDGYALYKKENGRFYMVLDGEGASLQAVGKVYGPNADITATNCRRYLRLGMKGRITIDGDGYVFALRGMDHLGMELNADDILLVGDSGDGGVLGVGDAGKSGGNFDDLVPVAHPYRYCFR